MNTVPYQDKTGKAELPISPERLFEYLQAQGIAFDKYEHEPTFTVAESDHLKVHIPGAHCRNLFVRDKKHTMFLIVAENETAIDLKKMQTVLGCGRLSFGSPERLWDYLGVIPGSVCPFAVLNDKGAAVKVILDKTMMDATLVNYHPMVNNMTISLTPDDLLKFLRSCDHEPDIMDLSGVAPDSE